MFNFFHLYLSLCLNAPDMVEMKAEQDKDNEKVALFAFISKLFSNVSFFECSFLDAINDFLLI
jgi:hypothetical protein